MRFVLKQCQYQFKNVLTVCTDWFRIVSGTGCISRRNSMEVKAIPKQRQKPAVVENQYERNIGSYHEHNSKWRHWVLYFHFPRNSSTRPTFFWMFMLRDFQNCILLEFGGIITGIRKAYFAKVRVACKPTA